MPANFNYLTDGNLLFTPTGTSVVISSDTGELYLETSSAFPIPENIMAEVDNCSIIYNENNVAEIVVFSFTGSGTLYLHINKEFVYPSTEVAGNNANTAILTYSNVTSNLTFTGIYLPPLDFHKGTSSAKFCNILPSTEEVLSSVTKNSTENNYIVQPHWNGAIYATNINLNLPQNTSSGEAVVDPCIDSSSYGNFESIYVLLSKKSELLKNNNNAELETFLNRIQLIDSKTEIINESSIYATIDINNAYIWTKYFIMPVKTSLSPLNNEEVTFAIVAFDKNLSAFTTRLITFSVADGVSDEIVYITNNGILTGASNNYSKVLTFNNIANGEIILSFFKGFSFNTSDNQGYSGLEITSKKEWSLSSKTFSGTSEESYAADFNYYPVECGNRLLSLTSNEIINNASIGYDPLAPSISDVGANLTEEIASNIGYFNVAYGTAHGLILMRMHSYCPIMIPPSDPDGIELHIPGGNWDYQKEDGSFPFRELGGYTPVSMVFSPENNFLYTIVAKPDDRTEKYICIYNMSSLDAETMSITAKVLEDPFDAGLKSVNLLENGNILFSSNNGGEHILTIGDCDLQTTVDNISASSTAVGYNFGVSPIKRIHNTSNDVSTWKTSNTSVTPVQTLVHTTDTQILTPKGYLDLNNIPSGLTAYESFNTENNENLIATELILDNNGAPLLFVKVKEYTNVAQISIIDLKDNEIIYNYSIGNSKLHATFYEEAECVSVIKLAFPENTYGILVNAATHDLYSPIDIAQSSMFGLDISPESINGYNRAIIATVTIDPSKDSGYELITEFDEPPNYPGEGGSNSAGGNKINSLVVFPNASVAVSDGPTILKPQTYGAIKFISLEADSTHAIVLENSDNATGYSSDVDSLTPLRLGIRIINISDASTGLKLLSHADIHIIEPFETSAYDAATSFVVENVTSGFIKQSGTHRPVYSHSTVSHDASFIAAFWYNHNTGSTMKIFAPDRSTMSFGNGAAKHLAAEFSIGAEQKLNNFLNKNENTYLITSSEFSVSRRNIFLFLKNIDDETDFQIIKIDIGSITNYYNGEEDYAGPFSTYSIPAENIIEVPTYAYFEDVTLPADVSADLLSSFDQQNNTIVTGIFKSLNHRMYLLTKQLETLGLIVNPESIIGAYTYQSAVIKSGINLSQSQPQP